MTAEAAYGLAKAAEIAATLEYIDQPDEGRKRVLEEARKAVRELWAEVQNG